MIKIHDAIFPHEPLCNKTLDWFGMDSQELFEHNLKNKKPVLIKNGWLDMPVTYKFNQNGFRCEDFTNDPSVMFLGCSHTFGLGVPIEFTWTYLVASALKLKHVNLGWPATSNDTAFRYAFNYLSKIQPKIVVLMSPSSTRTDLIAEDKTFITFLPNVHGFNPCNIENKIHYDKFYNSWLSSDMNIEMNRIKNILAIKQLCDQNKIKFVNRNWEDFKFTDLSRDLTHFGINTHKRISEIFLQDIGTP